MIEVLVTMLIIAIGLLGLAGLQVKLHKFQFEAYQRSQALSLVQDMVGRINANKKNAASYVLSAPVGTGGTATTCTGTGAALDLCEWGLALRGAAEKMGTSNVGAIIGARGCVETASTSEYLVTVLWQGDSPTVTPQELANASTGCLASIGSDTYNTSGSPCVNHLCARAVSAVVNIANLTGN